MIYLDPTARYLRFPLLVNKLSVRMCMFTFSIHFVSSLTDTRLYMKFVGNAVAGCRERTEP